jgi:hypothetical protein
MTGISCAGYPHPLRKLDATLDETEARDRKGSCGWLVEEDQLSLSVLDYR